MTGEPSHFELGVPDAARAKAFYGELLGWSFETTTGDLLRSARKPPRRRSIRSNFRPT